MERKIMLVTGASDGIGKETAKTLAKQGHTVILHGRNPQKTQAAYEEIKAETGNPNLDVFTADFLSLAAVKQFAAEIKQKYDRLDVLVNNAGAQFTDKREETAGGFEKRMAINVFAPFLLPLAKATAPSIRAATSPEMEGVNGNYYGPKGAEKPSQKHYSPENEQKVWDYCVRAVEAYR